MFLIAQNESPLKTAAGTRPDHLGMETAPSAWVTRWSHLAPAGGAVLDLACGRGRHARWFHGLGHPLVLLDRDAAALESITFPAVPDAPCTKILADIEGGPWPLRGQLFDCVVVTNYLWRPLFAQILASLAPGGVLLYETFAHGQETIGKPSRPDFLLRPGELLAVCAGLSIVAFEDGLLPATAGSGSRFVQRIAAVRPLETGPAGRLQPARHSLAAPA